MTPAQCKTASEAIAAANGVNEARVILAADNGIDPKLDGKLFRLEMAYFRRADQLTLGSKR